LLARHAAIAAGSPRDVLNAVAGSRSPSGRPAKQGKNSLPRFTTDAPPARRLTPEPGQRAYFGAVFVGVLLVLGGLLLISRVDPKHLTPITDLGLDASATFAVLFLAVLFSLAWFVALRFARLRDTARRMRRLATRDTLTGIIHRDEFELRVHQILAHAKRHDRGMALLYVDLDGLEQINHSLGHAAGDEALRRAADTLVSAVRRSDLVGRIGGDEFAVVLTEIRGRHDAQAVAGKLRERLAAEIEVNGRIARISASLGPATYPEDASSADQLHEAAGLALEREKRERR